MSKHFYKDVKVIKFCKWEGCGVEYRPERGSFFSNLGLCHTHRREYYRTYYLTKFLPWWEKQTPAVQEKYRKMRYSAWCKWVEKNHEKRRAQRLASYHRRKSKHRAKRNRRARERRALLASKRSSD